MKHYVKILTSEVLTPEDIKFVVSLVERYTKIILHSEEYSKNARSYTMFTERSLLESEMQELVESWYRYSTLEVFFENTTFAPLLNEPNMEIMLDELARYMHSDDVRRKAKMGWRYGEKFSIEDKTSPLMLPWEQLPDDYKVIRPDIFAKVLEILTKSV